MPVTYPNRQSGVFAGLAEPFEEGDFLEFRLLFEGTIPASGNRDTKAAEKHRIRRVFHPQLRRLWHVNRNLRALAVRSASGVTPEMSEREKFQRGIEELGRMHNRIRRDFVPLVTQALGLRCSLEILLLRPEEESFLFERGDIDGQIKTLFDALRLPADESETDRQGPQPDEDPFYCLLTDDKLITDVKFSTDQLLLLPRQREAKANDCFATIHVKIEHKFPGTFDRYFD